MIVLFRFFFFFFFFKQKTAYEIVSRDWSSDVCSSDLTIIWVELSSQRILQKMLYANAMSYEVGSMPSSLVVAFNICNDRSSSMLTNRCSLKSDLVFRFMFYIGKTTWGQIYWQWNHKKLHNICRKLKSARTNLGYVKYLAFKMKSLWFW